jgi:hypothetical protein
VFKRLFWLVTGIAFGVTMALWAQRAVRRTTDRLRPQRMAGDVAGAVKDLGHDVRAAVLDGRSAMRRRELELRSKLDGGVATRP